MSLRFSKVNLKCNDKTINFLVGGLPTKKDDLKCWTAFNNFVGTVKNGSLILASVETYLYGGEVMYDATPDEIAYFYKRIEMRPGFIEKSTEKLGESSFLIRI